MQCDADNCRSGTTLAMPCILSVLKACDVTNSFSKRTVVVFDYINLTVLYYSQGVKCIL